LREWAALVPEVAGDVVWKEVEEKGRVFEEPVLV
jgi:hypothetical protein